jgi:hypothetical protein
MSLEGIMSSVIYKTKKIGSIKNNLRLRSSLLYAVSILGLTYNFIACQPNTTVGKNIEGFGIVNGEPVTTAQPIAQSTVNMYLDLSKQEPRRGLQNVCSGTLISPQVILTAAHCVADLSERMGLSIEELREITYIGFGTTIIKSFETAASAGVELHKISKIAVHPEHHVNSFSKSRPMHDIALLKMETEAPTSAKPAHLPTDQALIKNMEVDLAGFGSTNGNRLEPATQLMKTRVKIDKPNFSTTQFSYTIIEGRSACSGDSGGPAYLTEPDDSGSLVVFGVTSWGDRTCTQFGVYTSVTAMLPWLTDALVQF